MAQTSFNPQDKDSTVTLSNSNLTAASSAANVGVGGIDAAFSGKYYWEFTFDTTTDNFSGVGIALPGFSRSARTTSPQGYIFYSNGGIYGPSGNVFFASAAPVNGTKVCVALDLDNGKVWFRRNTEAWNNNAGANDPATNTGGINIASLLHAGVWPVAIFGAASNQTTVNFGGTAFTYTAPTGFGNFPDNSALVQFDRPSISQASGGTGGPFSNPAFNTSRANSIIVVHSWNTLNESMGISDTAGLTWTKYINALAQTVNGNTRYLTVWWALAPTALSGDVVTFTKPGGFSQVSFVIAAFANVNTTNPFDGNASLPKRGSGIASNLSLTGISSNATEGFLLTWATQPNAQSSPPASSSADTSISIVGNLANGNLAARKFHGGALSSASVSMTNSSDWLAQSIVLPLASAPASARITQDYAEVLRSNADIAKARITQDYAEALRSDVDIGRARVTQDYAEVLLQGPGETPRARVSQDYAEVLRSNVDIARARVTQDFAEVLRSNLDIGFARSSQEFAEVLRTDADYSPPPDATARMTQDYAEVLIRDGLLVHRTKKRRVITAMAGL